ncbi:KH domain-containing protein [Pseudodesulfovibrio sp. F-1]|uniref:RNA-binding protein KhpB n=1 Tax=Pseudodesulfovibrio alkaliphilus TaxID=2661613 RepID=A0A7K1KJZ3_9BACT|nr:protein jag [Pseudodesulfovibrio alkaliphilus]MUM76365.1 KH domain-containing protein [Pseudodesulfovibrio alkaliphilus]
MSDFKEFQGKNLDEAIENACDYFNLKRDRLEIEIIGGGSTGIFGIMGVKKAKVKARPRAQVNASDILNGEADPKRREAPKTPERDRKPEPRAKAEPKNQGEAGTENREARQERKPESAPAPQGEPVIEANGNVETEPRQERKPRERKPKSDKPRGDRPRADRQRTERSREERPPRERTPRQPRAMDEAEEHPRANLADIDPVVLQKTVHEVMVRILTPIIGETKLEITIEPDRVKVFIDDEENSGLIIGREGQTLSSIQYLVNRLVSRAMEASVRVQVDTGDYRERQDDKLRQVAWHLAEKAGSLGRTQSTKPLSSYHRRVIHLALQDNETVFTRSKGEGPMKRVLIVPKARRNGNSSRY